MLEIKTGSIVKSMAGHDSGTLFLVLRQEGDYVLLADGKRRKMEKTKRKKWKLTMSFCAGKTTSSHNFRLP